ETKDRSEMNCQEDRVMEKRARNISIWALSLMLVIAALATLTRRTASAMRATGKRDTIRQRLAASLPPASTTFTQTNLVSDVPGLARTTDPNLVNPWGMTLGTNSGLWVSDNGAGKATVYDGDGKPVPSGSPLVVSIPAGSKSSAAPTG